jgi:hypothetical protein
MGQILLQCNKNVCGAAAQRRHLSTWPGAGVQSRGGRPCRPPPAVAGRRSRPQPVRPSAFMARCTAGRASMRFM